MKCSTGSGVTLDAARKSAEGLDYKAVAYAPSDHSAELTNTFSSSDVKTAIGCPSSSSACSGSNASGA